MKRNHLFSSLQFISIVASLLPVAIFLLLGCSENGSANGPSSFKTMEDVDGNVYQTVKIGNQVWMAENLKVSHFRNGDLIPHISDSTAWSHLTTAAFCRYKNQPSNGSTYGYLYNWYAVTETRNIAPDGWHVPDIEDWDTLIEYLGGESVAGGKLKETGTDHWPIPNTGSTNESGFSVLPAGLREYSGDFHDIGRAAFFWYAQKDLAHASVWILNTINGPVLVLDSSVHMRAGLSVRLIKN